jgi:hypothetical protein
VKRYFNEQQITDIKGKMAQVESKTDRLLLKYIHFPFKNERAKHYAAEGFGRRIQMLRHCIHSVYRIIPLETAKVPSRTRLYDAQANIQAFLSNVYGIIDNLAWIWVFERGLSHSIPRLHVGLGKKNKQVRESLSHEMQTYLNAMEEWFDYLGEFRHALAHRIPVYIPPGMVLQRDVDDYNNLTREMSDALNQMRPYDYQRLSKEQAKLLVFQPLIAHSTVETKAPYVFHVQMIADFLTVEALAERMLTELQRPQAQLG